MNDITLKLFHYFQLSIVLDQLFSIRSGKPWRSLLVLVLA